MGNFVSWNNSETNISQQEFKEYQDKMNKIVTDLENKIKHLNQTDSLIQEFENEIQNSQINKSTTQKINWLEGHVDQLSSTINKLDGDDKKELKQKITQLNDIIDRLSTSVDSYLQIKCTIRHLEQKIEYLESSQKQTHYIYDSDQYATIENLESKNVETIQDNKQTKTKFLTNIIVSGSSAIYNGVTFPIKLIGNVILPEKKESEILIRNYNESNNESSNLLCNEELMDPLLGPVLGSEHEKPKNAILYSLNNLLKKDKKLKWNDKAIEYYYDENSNKSI
jgi:hypothetical protein